MQTKNSLITQLKEQITEITVVQKKQGEKVKRNTEIDQLKDLISQMTAQMMTSRKSVDKALASPQSDQIEVLSGEERLDSQSERTEADEDIDHTRPTRGKTGPINH